MTTMIRVGISGWTYPPWRGGFYPVGLAQKKELSFAAERLTSIEINGTFYALQRPASFASWHAQVPDDFVFSIKGVRFITHMKKLNDVGLPLANFFASGVLALERKLGPFLWQLPPNLGYNAERLQSFFELLPRTAGAAAELGAQHDTKIGPDRELIVTKSPSHPLRHALEVRHDSFKNTEFVDLARHHNVAVVVGDNPGQWPVIEETTSDFMYLRLHGDEALYSSGYTQEALQGWADKVKDWTRSVSDVFVYCDNDAKGHAPFDAMNLINLLD